MGDARRGGPQKPATAARVYDYMLAGVHNFPADQEVARTVVARLPLAPAWARANRAFLRRAVRHLTRSGVRQFLDIGSGIPTMGNVHEIAQEIAPDARVAYVDIDPVAVSESLEILDGNKLATAIRGDLREPQAILDHPQVRDLLDFDQPIALLLVAVLHFVADDAVAYGSVERLRAALAPGSYLVVSHFTTEERQLSEDDFERVKDAYRRDTTASGRLRSRAEIAQFFSGFELIDPGVVWVPEWRPEPGDTPDSPDDRRLIADPRLSNWFAGVGRLR